MTNYVLLDIFCVVFAIIVETACASIHLVKYSMATKAYLRLPLDVGSGPTMLRPHHCSGYVWAISFVSCEGPLPRGENFWQASHNRTTWLAVQIMPG